MTSGYKGSLIINGLLHLEKVNNLP